MAVHQKGELPRYSDKHLRKEFKKNKAVGLLFFVFFVFFLNCLNLGFVRCPH